tara:strand:- start:131 stop:802 length:672 start_codon:yes stop_codon:yes gene_type:complete
MIVELCLATSIIVSTIIPGTNGYIGDDMTDEDFEIFAAENYDMFESVIDYVVEHKNAFETGAVGGLTGLAIRGAAASTNPILGCILAGGTIELAKSMYKNLGDSNGIKEERIQDLESKLEAVLKEVNQMKSSNNHNLPTLGDFSSGHAHETRDQNTNRNDPRSSVYSLNGNHYTTDARDAGPHRDGPREYRSHETREIRDSVDRACHEATRDHSRDNYVERRD